jgi:hypothetical protein
LNNCERGNSKIVFSGSLTLSNTSLLVNASGVSVSKHKDSCFFVSPALYELPKPKSIESGSKISGNFRTSVESGLWLSLPLFFISFHAQFVVQPSIYKENAVAKALLLNHICQII